MTRKLYKWDKEEGKMIEIDQFFEPTERVHVITDEMPATVHHGLPLTHKNRIFTSKSKFREVTRQLGLIELGNEKPKVSTKLNSRLDTEKIIKDSLREVSERSRR